MKPVMCYIIQRLDCRRSIDEIKFLKEHYDVRTVELDDGRFKCFLRILKIVSRCDIVYSWHVNKETAFAVFLCNFFKKPCMVCIGGQEPADIVEYDYGAWVRWIDRVFVKYCFKHASKLLPVSKFMYDETRCKLKDTGNLFLLYAGVDTRDFFEPDYAKKNSNWVVTVGGVKWSNVWRKGLDVFVRLGFYLPNFRFIVVGRWIDDSIDYLKSIASNNVVFTGFVSDEKLKSILECSKVCCLLSYYEPFGSSLAEGMSFGCIPVVTDSHVGLTEIVGDTGFKVGYGNILETVDAVVEASKRDVVDMKRCRDRIIDNFGMDKRLDQLGRVLKCI